MHREEQLRIIKGLISHRDNDTNVDAGGQLHTPVSTYTCPERAALEWQEFFQAYPQMMGLSGDLPEAGSFMTSTELGKPIILTRDEAGKFHAFLNVCRHRGTVVENEHRGQKRLFSCPFHAWGYSAKGELVAVPKEEHFGKVDRSCHSLVALPAEEKYGMLWVHPDPQGTLNVDDCLGEELAGELASWDLGKYNLMGDTKYDHAMNWKLAIDTFGETYHFNALHKNTLAESFYGNAQMYDTFKRNHRMALCLKSVDDMRAEPEDKWHVLRGALPVYYLFPNTQLIVGMAGPTLFRIYPKAGDPNNSCSQISFYLDPMIEKLALDPERREMVSDIQGRMHGFASVIEQEDYVAAASSHVGALSGAQEHVVFGRNEPALHHYHNTYREALGMSKLELVSA
ncbi:MAG: aromatic ring-hydroxylating dioxygenase subunit alpha [Pseudomonadota bacterium]